MAVKLSIIIVNYNSGPYLERCFRSVLAACSGLRSEIIVVDNASTDDSIARIKNLKQSFEKLQIVLNKRNLGFAKANNIGLKKAQGEYILLLNPDTRVPPATFKKMIAFMDTHGDIGAATCKVLLPTGNLDWASHRGFPTPWNAFCYFLGLSKLFPKSKIFSGYHQTYKDLSKPHEIDSPSGAFYLVRKDVVKKVGLLDEDYFMYAEDLDWSWRIKAAGFKIYYYPQVQILHYKGIASGIKEHSFKLSQAQLKTRLKSAAAFYDTMRIFYQKHYENQYPRWIKVLVFWALELLKNRRLAQLKRSA